VVSSCVSQELPFLKSWFAGVSMPCSSKWVLICVQIICSSCLHRMQVSETVLAGSFRLPFLNTGVTHASFHASGKVPDCTDCWNKAVIAGDNSTAKFFNIQAGISSGPDAFEGFSETNSFRTPFSVITKSFMEG